VNDVSMDASTDVSSDGMDSDDVVVRTSADMGLDAQ